MATRILFLALLAAAVSTAAHAEDAPRFNRDVRPILSANCFQCHGPDAKTRKAGLRLDVRDSALAEAAIVPGDPAASELIKRITTANAEDVMPPPGSDLHLTPKDIDTLTRWIAAGAEYEPHWALVPPPDAITPPAVADPAGWARTPIDAFVLARLNSEGLQPASPADKATLLRRASLDLTGLPPTLAQLDAFLADNAPDAFARAVDGLLAAPAYGERMALDWLDAARYADTFGYQADVEMDVWPWRDWVIKAFNDNLPYDTFITWQLAGDLLDNPTQEQRLATAFNRLHRQTNEGGSINEEFRVANVADRTETFGTAMLGLTMNCAKCHDHKFDPISQRDYYSMFAFFANIDESGLYSHFTHTAPTPSMLLYKEGEAEKHAALKATIADAAQALAAAEDAAREGAAAWLADPAISLVDPKPRLHWPLDTIADSATPDTAAPDQKAKLVLSPAVVPGADGQAFAFDGDNGVEGSAPPDFERWQPFTLSLWLKLDAIAPKAVVLHRSKAETDAASRGWELLLNEGRPQFALVHFWPGNAIRVLAKSPLPTGQWVHLAARYDGSSKASGLTVYLDGAPMETETVRDNLFKTVRYEGGGASIVLAQRFRDAGLKGAADDVRVYDSALAQLEIAAIARRRATTEQFATTRALASDAARAQIAEYYALRVAPAAAEARAKLAEARRAESEFVETVRNIMAMQEMPQPRQSFLLARGAYDHPADPVEMDTPHALPPFPGDQPRNRLGLARWLTHPRNPLTARVAVNRYWQIFFGRGLVETQEDFGSQGKPPTNPELLDFLARDFINSGWNIKRLCKSIVLSAAYQQSSAAGPDLRARDPFNQLLARGPSFRLSAEQIRDAALAASGLLNPAIGGPSVKPYQPAGLWEDAASTGYTQDTGPALYRRGMYTFIKRTVPPPATLTFDAGTREVCAVRRERTMTPLQALVLLNDPQYVEAARVLAERTLAAQPGATPGEQIRALFRALTSRDPIPAELAILTQAFGEQKNWFSARPEDAQKYAQAGEAPHNETLDPIEVAATSALAQAIMNLDDFQMRR